MLGFLSASICCFLAWMMGYFSFFVTLAKASTSLVANVNYAFTIELYPTTIRVTALGTSYSFGRIG